MFYFLRLVFDSGRLGLVIYLCGASEGFDLVSVGEPMLRAFGLPGLLRAKVVNLD